MFKGIFFATGKVKQQIPIISNNYNIEPFLQSSQERESFNLFQEEVIATILKSDYGFFNKFETQIKSNDPIIIKECLLKTAVTLEEVLENRTKKYHIEKDKISLKNIPSTLNPQSRVKFEKDLEVAHRADNQQCMYEAIAVVAVAAVAVAVYLWAAFARYMPDSNVKVDKKSTFPVDEITRSLVEVNIIR